MKRISLALAFAFSLACASCINTYDDFEFSGTVVGMEMCTSAVDIGYAISLEVPDSVGADYTASNDSIYRHVVVVYNADRRLRYGDRVSGRLYLDPHHSEAECYYHYRSTTGEVPEACFTRLRIDS